MQHWFVLHFQFSDLVLKMSGSPARSILVCTQHFSMNKQFCIFSIFYGQKKFRKLWESTVFIFQFHWPKRSFFKGNRIQEGVWDIQADVQHRAVHHKITWSIGGSQRFFIHDLRFTAPPVPIRRTTLGPQSLGEHF